MGLTTSPNANNADGLKDSAVAVKDAVADLASEANRYARQRVSNARDSASAMMDTVKSKAEDYNENVVGFIRKNPYATLAIAAGVGFAIGLMLRRR